MSIYAKVILLTTLLFFQIASIAISKNIYRKSIRNFLKAIFLSVLIIGILSPKEFIDKIAMIIGVGRGPDALLYILIILFITGMQIIFTKFAEIEEKLNHFVQNAALLEHQKNKIN
tara:strand:+ start:13864 stop:14211 length:348 start_codon:yes stop_codon:yes gene_type:complete